MYLNNSNASVGKYSTALSLEWKQTFLTSRRKEVASKAENYAGVLILCIFAIANMFVSKPVRTRRRYIRVTKCHTATKSLSWYGKTNNIQTNKQINHAKYKCDDNYTKEKYMVAQYCVKFIQSEHNAKQAKTVQLKYFEERKKKSGVTKKISEISRTCIWKFNNST